MSTAGRVTAATISMLLLTSAGYGVADAVDLVPGALTTAAPDPTPEPFPTTETVEPEAWTPTALGPEAEAPVPDPDQIAKLVETTIGARATGEITTTIGDSDATVTDQVDLGETWGLHVVDYLTGDVLADVRGSTPRVPASTAKLLSATAAMAELGPDHTVDTTVVQGDDQSSIYLVGGGDVMLAPGKGDPTVANGHAGLGDLAEKTAVALKKQKIDSVALHLDDTLFTGPLLHPLWESADAWNGTIARIQPIMVMVGRTTDKPTSPRQEDPALYAAQVFAEALKANGIAASAPDRAAAPDNAKKIAAVASATFDDVIAYQLQYSDNTLSEVLGRLVALHQGSPGDFDNAVKAVLAANKAVGVDLTGVTLIDCSGLSHSNLIPPRALTSVIRADGAADHPELRAVLRGVPVAGLEGTLVKRFMVDDGPSVATGNLRAKTGTLRGVTSLAGFVQDADGRLLVFSAMVDSRADLGAGQMQQAIDSFLVPLAGCGCS